MSNYHTLSSVSTKQQSVSTESELTTTYTTPSFSGRGEITKIDKCDGDASANNRKAKLIFFYEWDLRLEWKGKLNGSDAEHHGTVEVPNLSDENDESDLDVSAAANARNTAAVNRRRVERWGG